MKDIEMLNDLIIESREHIGKIEPDLLELEKHGEAVSDELINRVFRAVHSIKGGFSFFGISMIVNLAHAMENIMAAIRDKKIKVNTEITDALLMGMDKLQTLLDDVHNAENIPIDQELAALAPFLATTETESRSRDTITTQEDILQLHPNFNESHMIEAIKNGKHIYQIFISPNDDIFSKKLTFRDLFTSWEKFGNIIDSNPGQDVIERFTGSSHPGGDVSILFSTVLEPDLIGNATGIVSDKIYHVDLASVKQKVLENRKTETPTSKQTAENEEQKNSIKKVKGNEQKFEDALRVRVSLLNNLMNFAGELVLARNQLLQSMNQRLIDSMHIQKITSDFQNQLRQVFMKLHGLREVDPNILSQTIDSEIQRIDHLFKNALNVKLSDCGGINSIIQNIDMVTTVLQENIMQTRMQPLAIVFSKFPRVIHDLAKKLNKEISLVQIGQDVELDKSIIELLSDPLTHLIRNSADHGIESLQTRIEAGKNPKGLIQLRAYQEGSKVIIEIEDDGGGINVDIVKNKAIEKGLLTKEKAATMSLKEMQALIFTPGFSTASKLSDISGRGVGMDVVKTNIERLGGTVEVESVLGKGTKITMKLPLTLAIIPSLIVKTEGRSFAVPQVGLEEVVRIRANDITRKVERVHSSEVLRLRGKLLPLVRLSDVLGISSTFIDPQTGERKQDRREHWSDRRHPKNEEKAFATSSTEGRNGDKDRRKSMANAIKIVVLRIEAKHYGLVVDDVQDSEEIVVKPLPDYLMKGSQCYAGATIMGDGKVAMILDPNGIALRAQLQFDEIEKQQAMEKIKAAQKEQQKHVENILLFSIGGNERFAIDIMSIARIEKRTVEEIQSIGEKEFVNYDNSSLRLFRIERYLPIQQPSRNLEMLYVIVPKNTRYPFGIVSSKVEDTMQIELKIDQDSVRGTGIKGTAILNDKMTIVLDIPELITTFEEEFVH